MFEFSIRIHKNASVIFFDLGQDEIFNPTGYATVTTRIDGQWGSS
jgi:hypothetical protein